MPEVADQDGGLPGDVAGARMVPRRIDLGDRRSVGIVLRIERNALACAVGIDGGDAQLEACVEGEDLLARLDFERP